MYTDFFFKCAYMCTCVPSTRVHRNKKNNCISNDITFCDNTKKSNFRLKILNVSFT